MDAYTTINNTQEISRSTSYFLGNIDMGIGEFTGMGYRVNNVQMIQTIMLQLMMLIQFPPKMDENWLRNGLLN